MYQKIYEVGKVKLQKKWPTWLKKTLCTGIAKTVQINIQQNIFVSSGCIAIMSLGEKKRSHRYFHVPLKLSERVLKK